MGATRTVEPQARPTYEYDLPNNETQDFGGVRVVGIREPALADEQAAARRVSQRFGALDQYAFVQELAKAALCSVDGREVKHGDADADLVWERLGFAGRALVCTAYNDIASPKPEATDAFRASRRVVL